jgi:type II secretory pathway component GspD/PulD (secretin)
MLTSRFLLLVPSVALALGACQSELATHEALGVDPQTGVVTQPVAATAQDPKPQDSVEAQRVRLLVAHYLEEARKLRVEGKLDEAKAFALKARDLAPQDAKALELLNQISAEQGEGAGSVNTFAEQQQRLAMIREERARAEVQGRLDSARQLMQRGNYAGAVRELKAARLSIDVGSAFDWGALSQQVNDTLAQAEAQADEALRTERDREEQEIADQLRAAERAETARRNQRVTELTREAMTAFERRQFRVAQDSAFEAMRIDPTNENARNVHNAAIKAERERRDDDYYNAKVREWSRMKERDLDLKIPQTDIIRVDGGIWQRAAQRQTGTEPTVTATLDDQLRDKVRTTMVDKISFTEETGAYRDVIKVLQTRTDIPIIITPEARAAIDAESLVAQIEVGSPISLANFLTFLTGKSEQLAWTVRNGVVEFTTKAKAGGSNYLLTHDIRDLIFPLTDFIPPLLRDIPVGESSGPRTGGEAEEKTSYVDPTTLKGNVQDATGSGYWDAEGGGKIDIMESGYLLVTANADMHKRVAVFLSELRRFATAIVSIESKFLTISQNFLQEIGVDFRGLGGSGKGSVATLDDVTNRLDDNASRGLDNSGTGDEAGAPTSGAFFNDGGDGDVRGRTENFFNNRLARNLSSTGGLTAAWTWLDDLQLQTILRAVEKRSDVQLVNGQQLSVVNAQRAHVAVMNQTSYVKDYEVEVAQASFIADPKVDVIQDGLILDVRPVISYDRKRITLNLQPTVAELQLPIPTFTTSLAGSTLPVTLQLPTMTVRQFATTVTVPDGGSVLIGGLREVLTTERRAEVPFFGKLPLISFLFKQEGVADENTSLMVLIRASVTDVHEHMQKR